MVRGALGVQRRGAHRDADLQWQRGQRWQREGVDEAMAEDGCAEESGRVERSGGVLQLVVKWRRLRWAERLWWWRSNLGHVWWWRRRRGW